MAETAVLDIVWQIVLTLMENSTPIIALEVSNILEMKHFWLTYTLIDFFVILLTVIFNNSFTFFINKQQTQDTRG